jgi:peptidoglycan/LPS O-acetylase OafA/YrhL
MGAKYPWLDLVRGVAALLVCANHLRAAMFVDYSALEQSSILVRLFYFVTGLGSQSVVVFFVLSGFFVGGSVIKRWEHFSYRDYLLARVTRLWIVLIPALAATYLIDRVTLGIFPEVFTGAAFEKINSGPNGLYSDSLVTFVENLLFLQTISAPVFGSNGPLWSLSNEFWYYICFPLIFLAADKRRSGQARVLVALTVAAICIVLLQDKLLGFLVWMIGALVYWIANRRVFDSRILLVVAVPLFLLALACSRMQILPSALDMIVLGISSGLLIVVLRNLRPMSKPMTTATEYLSRASYSLYLVHFPFVLLMYAVLFKDGQVRPDASSLLVFTALLSVLVVVSQLFWFLFERHTDTVKVALSALLGRIRVRSQSW